MPFFWICFLYMSFTVSYLKLTSYKYRSEFIHMLHSIIFNLNELHIHEWEPWWSSCWGEWLHTLPATPGHWPWERNLHVNTYQHTSTHTCTCVRAVMKFLLRWMASYSASNTRSLALGKEFTYQHISTHINTHMHMCESRDEVPVQVNGFIHGQQHQVIGPGKEIHMLTHINTHIHMCESRDKLPVEVNGFIHCQQH